MAYGLKYILRYETQRFGTNIRVLIYEKDFTGEATPKRIGENRIHLTMDRDEKIKGSTLDFSIISAIDNEFSNFFTLDNKAHKVELEFNYGVCWTGYIVSDQYSEPFVAPPYPVDIMCTDGLGLLKNEMFELTGMVSRFEALRYCIDKTGLSLPYAININVWEQNMDQSGHNMLDQLYFDASILAGKTCYDAINSILPENVFINQANGFWMVERPTDRTLPRYIFNADGTPSSETYNWHTFLRVLSSPDYKAIDSGSLYPIGYLTKEMQSAWRKFTIKQVFGKRESFFRNYDFSSGKNYWSDTGLGENFYIKNQNSKNIAVISGYQSALNNSITNSIKVVSTSAVTLSLSYALVGVCELNSFLRDQTKQGTNVVFQLKLHGNSGAYYYLDQSGWSTTAKNITIEKVQACYSFDDLNFQEFKFVASKLPESGTITVTIFQTKPDGAVIANNDLLHFFKGLCIESIKFYNNDITQFNDTESTDVILNENATESQKTIELMPVDLPNYDNADLFFDNGNYVKVNGEYVTAKKWGSEQKTYLEYMAAYMAYLYQSSRSVLKGEISGWLELNSYIIHNLSGKIFMIDKGTWNVLEHTFTLDIIELPDGEFIYDNYVQTLPDPFVPQFDIDDTNINHVKTIDGSFEVPLKNTATPVVVARKKTIDSFKLDFDSGTPQFSVKDALVETSITTNSNVIRINTGEIISHNFSALDRSSIRMKKEASEEYDPTRTWNIAQTDIELPDDDGYFLYVKVPID
jgi:hypothetical protein